MTVGDVQAAEDNVFTTTVATSGSLPEHVLVDQHTLLHMLTVTSHVCRVPKSCIFSLFELSVCFLLAFCNIH